jgi:biotin carboxyl carrier protein
MRHGRECGMPDITIVTEVAGRVCAIHVEAGASIADGDEVAFVEAMKMEIPVTSTASGKIKSILVNVDEMIAEGQAVAVVET